jgi:hypothetical protein
MTNEERLAEIETRHSAATPGPWRWFGNLHAKSVYLATVNRGRIYIMDFVRWGMGSAAPRFNVPSEEPVLTTMQRADGLLRTGWNRSDIVGIGHPDAVAIEYSWEDVDCLIADVRELKAQLSDVRDNLRLVRDTAHELSARNEALERVALTLEGELVIHFNDYGHWWSVGDKEVENEIDLTLSDMFQDNGEYQRFGPVRITLSVERLAALDAKP